MWSTREQHLDKNGVSDTLVGIDVECSSQESTLMRGQSVIRYQAGHGKSDVA
jgi:hypothetical protein